MGAVYRALQISLKREVALKLIRRDVEFSDELLTRFQREAELAATIRHPNIVGILDVGSDRNHPYLAMELVHGRVLADLIQANRAGLRRRIHELLGQLILALAAVHGRGMVHRDIKPANIMIRQDGRLLLMDFGLVKDLQGDGTALTQPGNLLGTPAYLPPEVLQGETADARGDLWALGCVIWECIEGIGPFFRGSLPATFAAITQDPLPEPGDLEGVTTQTREFLGLVLQRDPAERPASGVEALEVWESLGRRLPHASGAEPQESHSTPGIPENSGRAGESGPGSVSHEPDPGTGAKGIAAAAWRNWSLKTPLLFLSVLGILLSIAVWMGRDPEIRSAGADPDGEPAESISTTPHEEPRFEIGSTAHQTQRAYEKLGELWPGFRRPPLGKGILDVLALKGDATIDAAGLEEAAKRILASMGATLTKEQGTLLVKEGFFEENQARNFGHNFVRNGQEKERFGVPEILSGIRGISCLSSLELHLSLLHKGVNLIWRVRQGAQGTLGIVTSDLQYFSVHLFMIEPGCFHAVGTQVRQALSLGPEEGNILYDQRRADPVRIARMARDLDRIFGTYYSSRRDP